MSELSTDITSTVRTFYADCPFNGYSSPDSAARSILELNQVAAVYPDLDRLLKRFSSLHVADCGCGPGWFSSTVKFYYPHSKVTGYDFNPRALELASETAHQLKLTDIRWQELDLFEAPLLSDRFDVVASIGVLHHTYDCHKALQSIATLVRSDGPGYLYIGLYHLYGRRPFLAYFEDLKNKGYSEEALFDEYKKLHHSISDTTHLYSWFRDQVLHPHETQHTFEEMVDWMNELGFTIESTSINRFAPISSVHDLIEQEKNLERVSYQRNVVEKRYFPGFFTVCARRNQQ